MNSKDSQEEELIVLFTGKAKGEVLDECTLSELIRLSRWMTFINHFPI